MNRCTIKFDGENNVLIIEIKYMHIFLKIFNFFCIRSYFCFTPGLATEIYKLKETKIYEVFTCLPALSIVANVEMGEGGCRS